MNFVLVTVLMVVSLVLWLTGAHAIMVFGSALLAWVAFAFMLLPRIREYRYVMGIDDELMHVSTLSTAWIGNRIRGFKVYGLAFLMSMLPFVATFVEWLSGQDLSFFFEGHDPIVQKRVMFALGVAVFVLPQMVSWLHTKTTTDAATAAPLNPPSNG